MYHAAGNKPAIQLRTLSIATAALLGTLVSGQPAAAQALSLSVFERYLDSFRIEAGIPGMSAAVVHNGTLIWERGLGRRDVDASIAAAPDTPYAVGGLSEIFGAALLLRMCVEQQGASLDDPVAAWFPTYPEGQTTLAQLLSHTAPGGAGYQYSPARFGLLTGAIEQCSTTPYRLLLTREILDRFAMVDAAPGQVMAAPDPDDVVLFTPAHLEHYSQVVARMAVPYRVIGGRPHRNGDLVPRHVDAADGLVASVRDLARFDAVLDTNLLLSAASRVLAWTQATAQGVPLPTGLGWFVQNYNNEPILWQFGLTRGGHSSLLVKAPRRGYTLILLANSDGLSAPFALESGDVTASLFARLFLRFFVP